jgi:O-antigen ligase
MDTLQGINYRLKSLTSARLSTVFLWVGLFTLSWERFGNIGVGSFNVKLPVILFSISFVFSLAEAWKSNVILRIPLIFVATCALALLYAVIGVAALNPITAQLQTITVILGAIVPFFAIALNLKLYPQLINALNALIYGATLASIFGIYQLIAFYIDWPQIVSYRATDVNGLGRISSFSYESGYFGYFLIIAIAAVIARGVLTQKQPSQLLLGFYLVTLVLTNSRAAFVTIPILFVIFLIFWPRTKPRPRIGVLLWLGTGAGLFVLALRPELVNSVLVRFFSLFDPTEASSNAPRLQVLSSAWDIFLDNPLWGIGPSSFKTYLLEYGYPVQPGASLNSVIANNSWFQALLDGGLILLAAQLLFVILVIAVYYQRSHLVAWVLLSGWFTVLFVSSFVTSYFWDIKLWALLGLAVGAFHLAYKESQHSSKPRVYEEHRTSKE